MGGDALGSQARERPVMNGPQLRCNPPDVHWSEGTAAGSPVCDPDGGRVRASPRRIDETEAPNSLNSASSFIKFGTAGHRVPRSHRLTSFPRTPSFRAKSSWLRPVFLRNALILRPMALRVASGGPLATKYCLTSQPSGASSIWTSPYWTRSIRVSPFKASPGEASPRSLDHTRGGISEAQAAEARRTRVWPH